VHAELSCPVRAAGFEIVDYAARNKKARRWPGPSIGKTSIHHAVNVN
jgi:hypothetical protein